jgi:hypothetical protein
MNDKLPGEEWKAYQRRTGGDYDTWRKQVANEAAEAIRRCRDSMSPEDRAFHANRGLEVVRELISEWNDVRVHLS